MKAERRLIVFYLWLWALATYHYHTKKRQWRLISIIPFFTETSMRVPGNTCEGIAFTLSLKSDE